MSRCFPFPPPGYEKKGGIHSTDLLTKERHKEKRQKKDKDKERKEGKEKKDKERSKEKHKEKKERREKHKDRDRDRGKNQASDEKRAEGLSQFHGKETRVPYSLQNNEVKDSKFVQELARRIRDENGAAGNLIVQKNTDTNERRAKLPGRASNQAEESRKVENKNAESRKVNGQRNQVAARGLDNVSVQEFFGMDEKRVEGIAQPVEKKDLGKQMEGKEKDKQKENDGKRDKDRDKDPEKKSKSKDKDRNKEKKKEEKMKERSKSSNEQPNVKEGIPKFIENGKEFLGNSNSRQSDLSKSSGKSSTGEGNLGKRKEPEMNGFLLDNGIRPKKLPRPVTSFHPVLENGRKLESNQNSIQFASGLQEAAKSNNHKVNAKNQGINGLMEAKQPNVLLQRLLPAVQVQNSIESVSALKGGANNLKADTKNHRNNGLKEAQQPNVLTRRSLPAAVQVQNSTESASGLQGAANNQIIDNNGLKVNDLMEAKEPSLLSKRPLPAAVQVKENGEAPPKPPHPDSKYLNQVFSVPKIDQWLYCDDQEWLFGSNYIQSKKAKVNSSGVDEIPQVWDEALKIESADVLALPYVTPY